MAAGLCFIHHNDSGIVRLFAEALRGAGYNALTAQSEGEIQDRLVRNRYALPDIAFTPVDAAREGGGPLVRYLRSNPLLQSTPIVVICDDEESRRTALRMGLMHVVLAPYDAEQILLAARLAQEGRRNERLLSGALAQFSVSELLQTAEAGRRSGVVVFRRDGRSATLWLRDGRVVDAEGEGGQHGEATVFAVAGWEDGSFEADFGPVSVPERINTSITGLLLEAARRRDEQLREIEVPPNAALPDPPPAPPRLLLACHRALTLLNVAASYASTALEPRLLAQRLERHRAQTARTYPELATFAVAPSGQVSAQDPAGDCDADRMVAGVGRWIGQLYDDLEAALPGRFDRRRLRSMTEALSDDMSRLGLYDALGIADSARPPGGTP